MEIITGIEAHKKMQAMRFDEETFFEMHHLTYSSSKDETSGMRIVKRCRLRKALPKEFSENIDPDMIVPYIDLETDELRMCYKHLIRKVAFPLDFKLLSVKWYD